MKTKTNYVDTLITTTELMYADRPTEVQAVQRLTEVGRHERKWLKLRPLTDEDVLIHQVFIRLASEGEGAVSHTADVLKLSVAHVEERLALIDALNWLTHLGMRFKSPSYPAYKSDLALLGA